MGTGELVGSFLPVNAVGICKGIVPGLFAPERAKSVRWSQYGMNPGIPSLHRLVEAVAGPIR
jgi:hypothetical protein